VLLLLLFGCLLVLRPFVSALLWAVVLACSSWPLYSRLTVLLGHRRTLAAILMGLGMVLLLALPLLIVGLTMADNVTELSAAARRALEKGPPPPPAWLLKVPVVGTSATEHWQKLSSDGANLWTQARRLIEPVGSLLVKLGISLGSGLMQVGLSIFIAFFFFRDGASLVERLTTSVNRLGGERGRHLLQVATNTMRGVVYGVLGTALIQAVLMGIGLLVAGVPGPGVLALLAFFVSVLPLLGTALVWLPSAIWLFYQGSTGWAIFMIIWGVLVNNIEPVIKPLLISKGSDMPFLLIFFGVLGGAVTFGFIGIFIGPTLLAVGYRVIQEWSVASAIQSQSDDPTAGITKTRVHSQTELKEATVPETPGL
jgi:predicted PurR-regulated permease PerM